MTKRYDEVQHYVHNRMTNMKMTWFAIGFLIGLCVATAVIVAVGW